MITVAPVPRYVTERLEYYCWAKDITNYRASVSLHFPPGVIGHLFIINSRFLRWTMDSKGGIFTNIH